MLLHLHYKRTGKHNLYQVDRKIKNFTVGFRELKSCEIRECLETREVAYACRHNSGHLIPNKLGIKCLLLYQQA